MSPKFIAIFTFLKFAAFCASADGEIFLTFSGVFVGYGARIPQNTYRQEIVKLCRFPLRILGTDTLRRRLDYFSGTDFVQLSRRNSSKLCKKKFGEDGKGVV